MSITPAIPSELDSELKSRRKGRWMLVLIVVILLAIFVPPFISLNRLKASLGAAVGNAIGRQVSIGRISLRLLPRPGFNLSNVNIQDDPAFSAEPMLHADQVTATLRLSSLWRRRLEIASLSFHEPSLNLVRNDARKWNFVALLERAQQIPSAPTARVSSESRPRFPYVEAEDARINFKIGMEKKAYAFSEADFALWLASEDEWHVRLEARPIRGDRNLHDTGVVKLEGTFQRASDPRQTPLNLTLALEKGQLGQLSEFVYGRDRGWRGGLDAQATVSGTPADLQLTVEETLDDFRRYDITGSDSARIRSRCTAKYVDSTEQPQSLNGIDCRLPSGNGEVRLRGNVQRVFASPEYDLSVAVSHLPATALANAARRMKKDVIADLSATGEVNAALTVKTEQSPGASEPVISGGGSVSELRISSKLFQPELAIAELKFAFDRNESKPATRRGHKAQPDQTAGAPATLRITATPILLGAAPERVAYLEGAIRSGDFSLSLRGQADLARIFPIARALGLNAPKSDLSGVADMNLQLKGVGHDFSRPWLEGRASLANLQLRSGPLPVPLSMDYATADFSRGTVNFWTQEAVLGNSGIRLRGNVTYPLYCESEACPIHFALSSGEIRLDDLNSIFNPRLRDRPWYSFAKRNDGARMKGWIGDGTVAVGRLMVKSASVDRFSAFMHLADGKLDLTNVVADAFGGKHLGEFHADYYADEPQYDLAGTITKASLEQLGSSLWPNAWHNSPAHSGTLDAKYQLHLSGSEAGALFKSAAGTADLVWANGAFTGHADNGAARTLAVNQFVDRVTWKEGALQIPSATLKTASGPFEISGTFARSYDLRVQSNGKPMLVAFGTLTAVPATVPVAAKK
jgi:hypothetical protein